MPVTWYSVDPSGQAVGHQGRLDDVSTTGVAVISRTDAAIGKLIALAIRGDEFVLDAVGEVRRVTRSAGGFRMGIELRNLTREQRVELTRFVLRLRA